MKTREAAEEKVGGSSWPKHLPVHVCSQICMRSHHHRTDYITGLHSQSTDTVCESLSFSLQMCNDTGSGHTYIKSNFFSLEKGAIEMKGILEGRLCICTGVALLVYEAILLQHRSLLAIVGQEKVTGWLR